MSDAAAPADGALAMAEPRRRFMSFQKRHTRVVLTPAQVARQSRITSAAWTLLGNRDAAIAFLNARDDDGGSTPLERSVESAEGLVQAEAALSQCHARLSGEPGA